MFQIDFTASRLSAFGDVTVKAPMSKFTTFKTGGEADVLVAPLGYEAAAEILKYCRAECVPLTVIGAGSNLLVSDRGIRGVVMRISSDVMKNPRLELLSCGRVFSDAAVMKQDFIDFAITNNLGNVEFMAGIPGAVGGGIIMNAGTFMGNFIDILDEITYIDHAGEFKTIKCSKSLAHYRGIDLPDAVVICSARFNLPAADGAELKKRIDDIISDRKKKHPWEYPSAGSVFKNPEGHFAWKLVNDAGLKGYCIGGAQVSELHTNFIINKGWATSGDIRNLIVHVQESVNSRNGVSLHTEVRMMGEF